jgi:hypothetical protein
MVVVVGLEMGMGLGRALGRKIETFKRWIALIRSIDERDLFAQSVKKGGMVRTFRFFVHLFSYLIFAHFEVESVLYQHSHGVRLSGLWLKRHTLFSCGSICTFVTRKSSERMSISSNIVSAFTFSHVPDLSSPHYATGNHPEYISRASAIQNG